MFVFLRVIPAFAGMTRFFDGDQSRTSVAAQSALRRYFSS
jgi:hypothetical protein